MNEVIRQSDGYVYDLVRGLNNKFNRLKLTFKKSTDIPNKPELAINYIRLKLAF